MIISQIKRAIIQGTFTNDELTEIGSAVKQARTRLGNITKNTLFVGAKVSFVSTRTGAKVTGVVRKIAIKNVVVDTVSGGWKVPANMLQVVLYWPSIK